MFDLNMDIEFHCITLHNLAMLSVLNECMLYVSALLHFLLYLF